LRAKNCAGNVKLAVKVGDACGTGWKRKVRVGVIVVIKS